MASPNDDDSGNSSSSSTCGVIAAALSNRSILQYDARTNQIVHRIEEAHDGPISELIFFPREYYGLGNDISTDNDIATEPPATLIMSASQDDTVKLFDLRVTSSSSQTSQSNSQKVVLASASEDGLLTIHDPSQSTEEAQPYYPS
eukprot:scaffold34911_cov76-Cyclotella_meneghiniana.AAC.6